MEKIQSGTKASGGPAVLDESKDDRIAFAKSNPNTNEVCKDNLKYLVFLIDDCVVKIYRRSFHFISVLFNY